MSNLINRPSGDLSGRTTDQSLGELRQAVEHLLAAMADAPYLERRHLKMAAGHIVAVRTLMGATSNAEPWDGSRWPEGEAQEADE